MKIFYEDFGVGVTSQEPIKISSPRKINFLLIGSGILAASVLLFFLYKSKRKSAPAVVPKVAPIPVTRGIPYSGKLILYFMKLSEDEEISPLEYNLFRRTRGEEITLAEIVEGCGVELKISGAENISFAPIDKGISVTNRSACTLTKNDAIILKGARENLVSDESLYIVFEDEATELLLIYKSLKPSERRSLLYGQGL